VPLLLVLALWTGQECQDLVARGRDAYERRAYADAASIFTTAVSSCSASEPLLLALAQAQLLARQVPAALDTLERVLALNRDNVDALKVQARALYLAGRDADAERALTAARARAPADDEIAYDLGRMCYQQNRYHEAAMQFQRAIALNPRSHKAYDNLGLATEALGDVPQAIRYYLKAIELVHTDHPHYDVVYANLADLQEKLGLPTFGWHRLRHYSASRTMPSDVEHQSRSGPEVAAKTTEDWSRARHSLSVAYRLLRKPRS
jgi:tetratricopeptide (TPR) repeat protein